MCKKGFFKKIVQTFKTDKGVTKQVNRTKLVDKIDDIVVHNPFVTFSQEKTDEHTYCIRILAFIPSNVTDFDVIGPSDKKVIKTDLGNIDSRTITIRWEKDVKPEDAPYSLWLIMVEYSPVDSNAIDNVIKVVYEYGDPKTTRGTVTTSGNPSSF